MRTIKLKREKENFNQNIDDKIFIDHKGVITIHRNLSPALKPENFF